MINPDSYKRCAIIIVCATVYPSLRAASCCRVEVVNGAGGVFFTGRVVISSIVKVAPLHASRNAFASSFVLIRRDSSAFISTSLPSVSGTRNMAITR